MEEIGTAADRYGFSVYLRTGIPEFRYIAERAFNEGADFINQWISIEQELPETDCFVLTKSKGNKDEDYFRVLWFRNFEFFTPEITSNITHWRPIEYK